MSVTIIPANPGFYAVATIGGAKLHLPVIAWAVRPDGFFTEVLAITLRGQEAENVVIIGPDGKQAHE